jgi:uncharacterized protein YbjT (DUF2867 family)
MRILVTGVSGFAGSLLAPKLLADGHNVRALARDPARVSDPTGASGIDVIRGDVVTGKGLTRALDGIEVAYYLIHSMETRGAGDLRESEFEERERLGANTFATHALRAGVTRIVYFGGLLPRGDTSPPPVSRHLASRGEVEGILFEHIPGSVALRSAIVIGARSRPFRLLVRLLERLPLLPLPPWSRFRTQPIDARDAIAMLAAAAHVPAVAGRRLDIGGPEALSYEQLLTRIAELLLVARPILRLRAPMTPLVGRLAAALAGEDPALTVPLMEGLQSDLLPDPHHHAAELLGVQLHSFDAAVERSLREWEASEPLAAR